MVTAIRISLTYKHDGKLSQNEAIEFVVKGLANVLPNGFFIDAVGITDVLNYASDIPE